MLSQQLWQMFALKENYKGADEEGEKERKAKEAQNEDNKNVKN